jgi:EAL domain-containing protein (putative c-di-GMP-specific phosphodiesterase class I)/GGDEF domain-containing protein
MIYNIYFDMCSTLVYIMIILLITLRKGLKKYQNRIFFATIIVALVAAVFDILSSIANSYPERYLVWVRDLFNYLFLFAHNATPFMFAWYVWALCGLNLKKKTWLSNLFYLPFVSEMVILTLNPFLHWVFFYDSSPQKLYTHGNAMMVLYCLAYAYVMFSLAMISLNWKAVQTPKKVSLLIFIGIGVGSVVYQMFNPYQLIELFFQSLAFIGILFTIENQDELRNAMVGTYNRQIFISDEQMALISHIKTNVIVIKFPELAYYNSTLGISFMEKILHQIGSFLDSLIKGDEDAYYCDNGVFALIIPEKNSMLFSQTMSKIQERFSEEWTSAQLSVIFPVQLCTISTPDDASSIESVMEIIDAPYIRGENSLHVVKPTDMASYHRRNAVISALERGLNNSSFQVYFQPIWNSKTNKIESAEALIRLTDPNLGIISPEEFIPLAESNGMIVPIGEFVLREVCRFFKESSLDQKGIEFVEVNLSIIQCMHKNLSAEFKKIVEDSGLSEKNINLEVTESATDNNPKMVINTINALFKEGFRFSLDDYGTGYSNFTYITSMPFDIVKLDKSLLWAADKDYKADVALTNNLKMLEDMGMKIVTEGVETKAHKQHLSELGCTYLQGFYFSKPLPEKEFLAYLADKPYLRKD